MFGMQKYFIHHIYLREKENNKIVLAKRPSIEKIDLKLKRGKNLLTTNNNEDVKGLVY